MKTNTIYKHEYSIERKRELIEQAIEKHSRLWDYSDYMTNAISAVRPSDSLPFRRKAADVQRRIVVNARRILARVRDWDITLPADTFKALKYDAMESVGAI